MIMQRVALLFPLLAFAATLAFAQDSTYTPAAQNALSTLYNLRSQCDNTAWTLSYSNDYKSWRAKRTSMFSMYYSASVPVKTPTAPDNMPAELRARFDTIVPKAISTMTEAATQFRDLATYINAKDFEDDGFKKGDTINAKLLEYGDTCHTLTKDIENLHADYAATIIDALATDPAKAERAAMLKGDMQAVQALATEMTKGANADRSTIEASVADISKRVEERKASLKLDDPATNDGLQRFYLNDMEEDVAVEMRKMLRETKTKPKEWAERLGDRPRSRMMQTRNVAFIQMPTQAIDALK